MADLFQISRGEVRTEAQRQRERVEQEATEARARVEQEEEEARQRVAQQEKEAQAKVEAQAKEAKEKAAAEAKAEQARTRKAQSKVEREAEAAKAKARETARLEARKKDLPFTKPQPLDVVGYISQVEVARKKAHSEGRDARAEVVRITDKYHKEVDKAAQEALSSIKKQKKGIDADIAKAGIEAQAEIAKQVMSLGSGIKEWESESLTNIKKAEDKYEADVQAALNRPGDVVFAEMLEQGVIPETAIYESYNKTTGEVKYSLKDTRPPSVIFTELQDKGEIPKGAVYKSYDSATGKISYSLPDTRTGQEVFDDMQSKGEISKDAVFTSYDKETGQLTFKLPVDADNAEKIFNDMQKAGAIPADAIYQSFNSITGKIRYEITTTDGGKETVTTSPGTIAAAAGAATLVLPGLKGTAWAMTVFPEPSSTIIGLAILGVLGFAAYVNRDRLRDMFATEEAVEQASAITNVYDMVVTDRSGTAPATVQQIQQAFTLQRGDTPMLVTPLEQPMATAEGYPIEEAKSINLTFPLIQELWQPEGFPKVKEKPVVMTRFPLDSDPILQGKARNIMIAAQAVAVASRNWQRVAVKEKVMTSEDYRVLQRLVEVGRKVITGEEYRRLEQIKAKITRAATSPNVSESHRIAYQEYLRKKIILDAARKAYVASLNPQPVKGVGSEKATAAAIGIWLAIDIMRAALVEALSKGQSVEQALKSVQTEIRQVAQTIGVTQKQLSVAANTVVYETALQSMTQAAINAAVQGQTEAQITAATQAATKIAVQVATTTHTLTATQVAALTKVLSIAAVNIIAMVQILPPPLLKLAKSDAAKKRRYPLGSIVWKQGIFWRGIPPPYKQAVPITTRKPPKGAVRTGRRTPQETLQIVGKPKAKVPKSVSVDLGVSDILIKDGKKIAFTGKGMETVVGKSLPSPSRGMSVPATAAKKYPAGSVAWKQGFIYVMITPPYGKDNIAYSRKPFEGVKTLKGAESAYKTIIKAGGKVPSTIKRDMGIMDIEIKTPQEGKPKLFFRADIKQERWRSSDQRKKRRFVNRRRTDRRGRRLQQSASRL